MLTESQIKKLIDEDALSDRKRQAEVGQRYYEAEHDILNYRIFYYNADGVLVEDKARSNSRICHPFFTEHVDQLTAFILSFEDNPIQAKPIAEGLQDHLDRYFDDEFWAEMAEVITGATAKGFDYLYGYKNAENRIAFQHADSMGVVEVREKDTDEDCAYVLYWYVDRVGVDKKKIKRIQVHSATEIHYFMQEDDGAILKDNNVPINPSPNVVWKDKDGALFGDSLGYIPFWRLDYNRKQYSALKPIKGLIDDYDMMECGLSNNLQDFDTPIHLVKGYEGHGEDALAELQHNIKTKKIIGVGEGGGVEVLTVDVPYQARKTKADEDEKNIYRFGMAFNSSQSGDGNITNVVIRSRYTLLELKADKYIIRIKRFLKPIIQVVLDEINAENKTDYQCSDIEIKFEYNVPTNEQENVQNAKTEAEAQQIRVNTVLNVAANVGDEQTLKAICDIMEWEYDDLKSELEKMDEEQNLTDAEKVLNEVMTDEQSAEVGAEAISE